MILTKEDIIEAVAAMATSEPFIHIDNMNSPFWGGDVFTINNSRSAEAIHIRNGGEPWKTKNKRGRR